MTARRDESLDLDALAARGAVALKLLVVWRPDGDRDRRVAMVRDFVARCRQRDLVSIVEPVSRAPLAGGEFDADAGILAAARELGGLGADVYKAEVPTHGHGTDAEILDAYRWLAAHEGVFCEPASAAGVAGLLRHGAEGAGRVVCVLTGHGLKDPQVALGHAGSVVPCEPDIDAVEKAVLGP